MISPSLDIYPDVDLLFAFVVVALPPGRRAVSLRPLMPLARSGRRKVVRLQRNEERSHKLNLDTQQGCSFTTRKQRLLARQAHSS